MSEEPETLEALAAVIGYKAAEQRADELRQRLSGSLGG